MHGLVGDGTLLLSVGVLVWLGSWAASVRVARAKGLSTLLWGALGFVFGPLAVLFLAFVQPPEIAPASDDIPSSSEIGTKPGN
jgi:hypothetical protein